MKKVFVCLISLCIVFFNTINAQNEKSLAKLIKIDSTYDDYIVSDIKQIPENIKIVTKSSLKYFTKVVDGYIGDVKLTDEEISGVFNLLSTTLKSSINITTSTSSKYQLIVIISSRAPYTYMDNNGYPWSGINGSIFFINSDEKLLYHYEEIDVLGNELNATIKKFADEASSKFTSYIKL